MSNIALKKSSVSGRVPLIGDLAYGELALNYADGLLYFKNSANQIKAFKSKGLEVASITGITQSSPFTEVTRLVFDEDTGFNLTELSAGVVKVALGSTFKTWKITGQSDLVAVGEDTVQFVAGSGITLTTDPTAGSKKLTITSTNAATGVPFAVTTKKFTGNGTTTNFTIDSGYTVDNLLVAVNGVLLNPTLEYTVSGTTLTFDTAPDNTAEIVVREMRGDGPEGATGLTGSTGIQGATGVAGASGIQGLLGATGASGIQGDTGLSGSTGVQGLTGSTGFQGASGYIGTDGATGIQGLTGSTGVQGIQGATGIQGVSGYIGTDGATGIQGIQGATGLTGSTGTQGLTGSTGADSTVAGPSGATGPQGIQGSTGIQGPAGVGYPFVVTTKNFTGNGTTTNFTIDSGYTVDSILVSLNGVLLKPTTDYTLTGTTLTFIIVPDNNDEIVVRQMTGDGTQGATGTQGTQGTQGLTGATGTLGLDGATGLTGATGYQGATGIAGATGAGATGVQGLIGSTGIQGLDGATGLQGLTGSTGSTGIQGLDGATGLQGATGTQGIQGTTGIAGSTGVQGATGAGTQGATGIQGPSGVGYPFLVETQSFVGNGSLTTFTINSGYTTDSIIVVANGAILTPITDYAVSGTTLTFTAAPEDQQEIIVRELKGDGPAGATGTQGLTGSTGAQGSTGITGLIGSTGIEGIQGATGIQGLAGSTGLQGSTGADSTVAGPSGATGYQGATGAGATGASGATGYQGATGLQGASGYIGIDGATGLTGATGPAGVGFPFSVVTKTFTGDGTTTNFTIDSGYTVDNILVVSNGLTLKPTADYTLTGTTLAFVTAPANGEELVIRQMNGDGSQGATGLTGATGPAGVGFPFSVVTKTFTGNGSTTNFTIDSGYTVDSILVISNGVTLTPTVDYTLSGTTLTFAVTPLVGQQLVVRQMTGDGYQGATGPQGPISSPTIFIAPFDYTLVLSDSAKHIYHPATDAVARTYTIPANATVAFPVGTTIIFINDASGVNISIACTADTLILAGTGTTGTRTLAQNGIATIIKLTSTRWIVSGVGLT